MKKFLTRVELHNARPEDYAKLHAAMTTAKFYKYITDDQGAHYELPTAEYHSHGPEITVTQVRDLAQAAANSTGRTSWILVTEYSSAAWSLKPLAKTGSANLGNLRPVLPPPPNPFLSTGLFNNPFSSF